MVSGRCVGVRRSNNATKKSKEKAMANTEITHNDTGRVVATIRTSFRKGTPAFRNEAAAHGISFDDGSGNGSMRPGDFVLFTNDARTQVCAMNYRGQVVRSTDKGRALTNGEIRAYLASMDITLDYASKTARKSKTGTDIAAATAARKVKAARAAAAAKGWRTRKKNAAAAKAAAAKNEANKAKEITAA